MSNYRLKLYKTYYFKGFFNVPVDFDRFVNAEEGIITLKLGHDKLVKGRINRKANNNATPRIHGNRELRDWFMENFKIMDEVNVRFVDLNTIHLSIPKTS